MTPNAQREFWLQFVASLVRKLLAIVGAFLLSHGWITADQSDGLTTAAVVELVVSLILLFGSSLWTWAKIKFNVQVVREARAAAPETPIGVITTETLEQGKIITSV